MEPLSISEHRKGVKKLVALAALAAVVLVSACTASADRTTPAPSTPPSPGCTAQVHLNEQLPEWARGGFSGDARATYAMSYGGQMVGVLFGYPLSQPPQEGRNNKILWVAGPASQAPYDPSAAPDSTDLLIDAQLNGRGEPVQRRIAGGPGPSIVDLPSPGCWRLSLRWGGRTDVMDLEYS
jgi:hypothetical protein